MRRVGIVDLGSNTARLVVYEYEPGKWFRLVDQLRERVRLGEGLGRDGELQPAAIERAAGALELFVAYAQNTELETLEVLATSAVRDAANSERFFERIAPLNLPVEVLSGEDEARLSSLAVANAFAVSDAAIVDLGGGSAQVSYLRERQWDSGRAFPLGAVRLTERFFGHDPPKGKQVRALERYVDRKLKAVYAAPEERPQEWIALGGSVRNLARAVQRAEKYPLDLIHGFFLDRNRLEGIVDKLLSRSAKKRARISGISPDRADILPAAGIVFRRLLKKSRARGLWISGVGVREGALSRHFLPAPHLVANVRSQSVANLLSYYTESADRSIQVREFAARLFEALSSLHGYRSAEAEILDTAAALLNTGLAINFYRQHRHAAYIVASGALHGFTHREQALLALLLRYSKDGSPKPGRYAQLFQNKDRGLLRVLVACLRLAMHLDRPRAGSAGELRVRIGERFVELSSGEGAAPALYGLRRHRTIFRSAFGRRLIAS